jgi:tetratricopeptide (TPR) repeat protein
VPNDNHTLADLATLEAGFGKTDLALQHAEKAVQYMPTDTFSNYTLGVIYQLKGRYDEAKKYLRISLKLNPKLVEGYTNLCWILNQEGDLDSAEEYLRNGIAQVPDKGELHFYLSVVLNRKGLSVEAQQEQQKAFALDPNLAGKKIPGSR